MSVAVHYREGEEPLAGHLHLPEGEGPFPAVVWGHGSERSPGSQAKLGSFYTSAGFALFVPHRRGHGDSAGRYPLEELREKATPATVAELVLALHERHLEDTIEAVQWLAGHPRVDSDRMAVSGVSYGGVQALLAAEGDVGARAYVAFAPGAMAWDDQPLIRERLLRAVRAARRPVLVVQADNDYSLGPARVLGAAAGARVRVFPAYGSGRASGHGVFGCMGTDVWGEEVRGFLGEALGP